MRLYQLYKVAINLSVDGIGQFKKAYLQVAIDWLAVHTVIAINTVTVITL